MNIMLIALFGSILFGLFGQKWEHREMRVVSALAIGMVVVYLAHPGFMN
jgi:hypothetical protein